MRIGTFIIGLVFGAVVLIASGCGGGGREAEIERHKQLAAELRDSRLYDAAIGEYQQILAMDDLEDDTRGSVNYLIARLYFENVQDYAQAAAYYVKAKALDPDAEYIPEASKNLVTALERSGDMVSAGRQLDRMTDIDAEPQGDKDVAVARISGASVWRSQIDDAIAMLPPEAQKHFTSTREAKIEFMRQYVAAELLYHAALREGFGEDPLIKRRLHELNRQLLVDKYVTEKVLPTITYDTSDVRNFYLAYRDSLYGGAPYDSVQARVLMDYQSRKAESAFKDYITMLSQKEQVEFYEQNVK